MGNVLVLYATGAGPTHSIRLNGFVATEAAAISIPNFSVLPGDIAAPGLITGIVKVNARIPDNTPVGKAVPMTMMVENIASPAGVTLNINRRYWRSTQALASRLRFTSYLQIDQSRLNHKWRIVIPGAGSLVSMYEKFRACSVT